MNNVVIAKNAFREFPHMSAFDNIASPLAAAVAPPRKSKTVSRASLGC